VNLDYDKGVKTANGGYAFLGSAYTVAAIK
jgi:hypothetical protein